MLWLSFGPPKNPNHFFPPQKAKKSLLPVLFPLMNPNKSHIKSHLFSMGLVPIFSPHLWGWWSFSEVMSCCQPSQGADYCLVRLSGSITHVCREGFGQQIIILLAPQERTKAAFCSSISLLSRKPKSMRGAAERAIVYRKWFDTSSSWLHSSFTFHYSWG